MPERYRPVPLRWGKGNDDREEHRFLMVQTINWLLEGRGNMTHELTLEADATETAITDERIGPNTLAFLVPKTATAAAAPGIYQSAVKGALTFYHDSNPATDRTFGVALLG